MNKFRKNKNKKCIYLIWGDGEINKEWYHGGSMCKDKYKLKIWNLILIYLRKLVNTFLSVQMYINSFENDIHLFSSLWPPNVLLLNLQAFEMQTLRGAASHPLVSIGKVGA